MWKIEDNQIEIYLNKLEDKLKEEKSWRILLDELTNGIITIDVDNKLTFANPAAFDIFKGDNWSNEELLSAIGSSDMIVANEGSQ